MFAPRSFSFMEKDQIICHVHQTEFQLLFSLKQKLLILISDVQKQALATFNISLLSTA